MKNIYKGWDLYMLKKTIKYTDYDGNEREEDFYFNLNKAEVTEMELSKQGGLSEYIKRIVAAQDAPSLVELFKELICKSYGEKSLDGKRFVKSKELTEKFTQTEAYAELFVELASNAEEATKFVNGIMPKNMNVK